MSLAAPTLPASTYTTHRQATQRTTTHQPTINHTKVRVWVYKHVSIYIFICACMYIYIYVCTHMYICIYIYTHVCTCVCVFVYLVSLLVYSRTYVYIQVFAICIYVSVYVACIDISTYIYRERESRFICIHIYIYIRTHTYLFRRSGGVAFAAAVLGRLVRTLIHLLLQGLGQTHLALDVHGVAASSWVDLGLRCLLT